jgi:hypothetical protein
MAILNTCITPGCATLCLGETCLACEQAGTDPDDDEPQSGYSLRPIALANVVAISQ